MCWKYIDRGEKRTKCPVTPRNGRNASVSDPQSWCTFEEALAAYEATDTYAGIAFAFSKNDPFCGIDLDRCLDESGQLIWGHEIVEALATYTEVSPSCRGLKLFLRGKKLPFVRCRRDGFGPDGTGEIEIYDHARVFAVTGRHFDGTPSDVMDRQEELNALCAQLWPQPAEPKQRTTDDRVDRCLAARIRMQIVNHNDGSRRPSGSRSRGPAGRWDSTAARSGMWRGRNATRGD